MAGLAASTSSGRGRQRGWRRRLSLERCERDGPHIFADQLPVPPASHLPALVRGGEPVAVVTGAEILRRMIRKRVCLQQRKRRPVALEEPLQQRDEPFVLRLRGERLEP